MDISEISVGMTVYFKNDFSTDTTPYTVESIATARYGEERRVKFVGYNSYRADADWLCLDRVKDRMENEVMRVIRN